jgi:TolB-like protein/DNA-binding winged helix-turn-helix (wHTH) protein
MERARQTPLRVGAWHVNPVSGEISLEGETVRLEVRTMRLLVCLAEHAGEVVSIDELLKTVWPDVVVSPDSVYQAVASLRRALGDDPKQPAYIATVPRLGYRMLAAVSPFTAISGTPGQLSRATSIEASPSTGTTPPPGRRANSVAMWSAGALGVVLAAALLLWGRIGTPNRTASTEVAAPSDRSIAVLPFLDLTEKMAEEVFADGLTEELIDKLARIPGVRVPPPTSSFYFKNKRRSVADIARTLNVEYVLDGSTRKSGSRLRVAMRLIRADTGVVVWSESYDRPWGDMLAVQDDIATAATSALRPSIESRPQTRARE